MSSTPGIQAFSRSGAKGTGLCGGETWRIGALNAERTGSATMAEMSEVIPQRGEASSTTTRRPVFSTEARIVSSSSGEVVRGSMAVQATPCAASFPVV